MSKNRANYEPSNLFVATGQEEQATKHDWDMMPEFDQPANESYKLMKIRFDSEEDLLEFGRLIGQTVTPKTKSIRFPAVDKKANSLLRWVDEEKLDDYEITEIIE